MRLLSFLIFFITSIAGQLLFSQEADFSFPKAEEELALLANKVVNDSLLEDRLAAYEQFETNLLATLKQPASFNYPFEAVQSVSIQQAPDSTFRIFTWQLFVDNDTYKYGGLIQKNDEEGSIYPLVDDSENIETYDLEYETLGPEEWYGALYYNIFAFDSVETKYLLFGYDGFEFFHKRKVAEILSFDEEGTPVFGAPLFSKEIEGYPPSSKNRLYLEYDASIAVRLNYDEKLNIIIHDHLVQMRGQYKGQGMVNVPDGSYEGYYFEEGVWKYKEKIFDLVSEEPPREADKDNPIKEKLDIFGKKRRVKKKKN